MKKSSLILLFSLGAFSAFAQQRITLDLQQTIALANDSSLEAFRTKNMYLAGYWEYRTYKANRLPSLTLNMTPAQYNRDITKRYDSEQDLDIYRSQQSFYAYGNLAVRQNFDLTGGTFYLDTELGYMRSFGGNKYTQFTSVPVRLGYSQSLVGYNPFRWERRIEPLKYEKVKKEYIYNAERVSEQATTYFFALAMAQAEYDLAKDNAVSTDTLYRIGMQRLKIRHQPCRPADAETRRGERPQYFAECRQCLEARHVFVGIFPEYGEEHGYQGVASGTSEGADHTG